MLWFKFCRFYHLQGGLSGGLHIDRSNVYLSNPDASLGRRMLFDIDEDDHHGEKSEPYPELDDQHLDRRRLRRSNFISHHNHGEKGAGFVYAVDNSLIVFKG